MDWVRKDQVGSKKKMEQKEMERAIFKISWYYLCGKDTLLERIRNDGKCL